MTILSAASDSDIRNAFHAKYLRRAKSRPDTLVIDELGLAHARSRVDVAVINGQIHGYEIKSSKDTLERLTSQIGIYRQTLQKLTIVAAEKHVACVLARAPEWCGVIEVKEGPRGGICFRVIRNARVNPDMNPVMMAHLLWRREVADILAQHGFTTKDLRRPRKELYEMLCEVLSAREIAAVIRNLMARRQAWRGLPAHA